MSKKHVPAVAGVAVFAALAVALVIALGGPLTAGADTLAAGGYRHARRSRRPAGADRAGHHNALGRSGA